MPEREREFSALFITNLEKKAKKENTFERINLTETATYTLLDLPSTCLSNEDENAQIVKQNNQKYLEVIFLFLFLSNLKIYIYSFEEKIIDFD